jgi:hypothetical protein
MSARWSSAVILALVLVSAGSCRTGPRDCEDSTTERCLWNQGIRQPIVTDAEPGHDEITSDSNPALGNDAKLNDTLTQMIGLMRAGLEWSLVDAGARALCSNNSDAEPTPAQDSDQSDETWRCPTALQIDTQSLVLEAASAVLSLSADALDEARSAELHELARGRFESWCATTFEEFEGTDHLVFYRCALPEGPYLVLARFPRDLEAGEWQISIAILDAG